jgi:hypothetical protein
LPIIFGKPCVNPGAQRLIPIMTQSLAVSSRVERPPLSLHLAGGCARRVSLGLCDGRCSP